MEVMYLQFLVLLVVFWQYSALGTTDVSKFRQSPESKDFTV